MKRVYPEERDTSHAAKLCLGLYRNDTILYYGGQLEEMNKIFSGILGKRTNTPIGNNTKQTIIINLGAGFSPLVLELAPLLGDHTRFIEMDRKNMSRKHELHAELVPDRCRFSTVIEADIADTTCIKDVLTHEMDDLARQGLSSLWKTSPIISEDPRWDGCLNACRILFQT